MLFILSLLATIVIPRFAATLLRSKLDVTLDAIRGDLSFARSRAVATGVRHQVLWDAQSREIVVAPFRPEEASGTTAGGRSPEGGTSVALRDRVPEEVEVAVWDAYPLAASGAGSPVSAQAVGTVITFYPEGQSDNARIVLTNKSRDQVGLELDGSAAQVRKLSREEIGQ